CSMIGFHTEEFRRNFILCCTKHVDCHVDTTKVYYQEREVLNCPAKIKEFCKTSNKKTTIVGVDRIDYIKGLPHKVRAFRGLLHQFPELDGLVRYIQIAVPCRSEFFGFKDLYSELKKLVDKINVGFSEKGLTSKIEMIFEKVSQQDVAVLCKKADVALVTPLRDGMNLVAMEYVASQADRSLPGVLILSKFAGTADTMLEALQVILRVSARLNSSHSKQKLENQ
ncbi:hypothetical protein QZH41_018296, partial [Actinostola sp. cb2023]